MTRGIEVSSIRRLKSGKLIEVVKAQKSQCVCAYIDREGRRKMPAAKYEMTLTAEFLDLYSVPYRIDGA